MNILLVISKFPPEYSGPGVRIPRLYDWFKHKGKDYKLQVICNGIEQTRSQNYTHKNLPVQRIVAGWLHSLFSYVPCPKKLRHSLIYQSEFIQTLVTLFLNPRYKAIDLLHIAGHSGGTAASLIWAKIKKIPVLMELVTANAPHRQKFLFIAKTPNIKPLKVIALTQDMKTKAIANGLEPEKIWCRPNPIDESKFSPPSTQQKQELRSKLSPFTQDQIVLSSVAKMMPQKNQALIIEALKYLPEKFVALIGGPIIKEGPLYKRDFEYVENMKAFIKSHKLDNRVHLVTDFINAPDYMKASDIYMMPAWNEGFGTPMIEAMGCGLPVIGNKDEPAFCEWIHNNKNGFLCDINNPEDWARAIQSMAELSQSQRKEISKETHKNAGQTAIYAQYENIINQLTNKI